jgi:hypothetical protein
MVQLIVPGKAMGQGFWIFRLSWVQTFSATAANRWFYIIYDSEFLNYKQFITNNITSLSNFHNITI